MEKLRKALLPLGRLRCCPEGPWWGGGGVGPVGGQDAGAEAGRPPLDPTSPLLPGHHSLLLPFWDEQGSWRPREAGGPGRGACT